MNIYYAALFIFILTITACCQVPAAAFYVDSVNGNDANDGRNAAKAWKSIEKVNSQTFAPGSKVLLKSGGVWGGIIAPKGSGTPKAPNTVGSYGKGKKPSVGGVVIENVECWEIKNLDISGSPIGVHVKLVSFGKARNIKLVGLDIHDIHGSTIGDTGGIICSFSGEESYFDGLLIENCKITHADRSGILLTDYPDATDNHRSKNVVIRKNTLHDIGGDGIFILACEKAVIEHNNLSYAHQRVGRAPGERACAGIWPQRSENTLIQYNEVSHTAVGGKTIWDSEAFDDDISCTGSVFQYNYSHDNLGGFMLFCGGKDTIVRYNISQNDQTAIFTLETDLTANCKIYNNTIYIKKGIDVSFARNTFGAPKDILFANNIIYADGTVQYNFGAIKSMKFENNCYFGNHVNIPTDYSQMTYNPKLTNKNASSAKGFKLKEGSGAIGAGKKIRKNGGRDYWGNWLLVGEMPSVGSHNP